MESGTQFSHKGKSDRKRKKAGKRDESKHIKGEQWKESEDSMDSPPPSEPSQIPYFILI